MTTVERARDAANKMRLGKKVVITVSPTGKTLIIKTAAPAFPLSTSQGKRMAQRCGVSHPHRIAAGGCCGWYGVAAAGGELVVVTTQAVAR